MNQSGDFEFCKKYMEDDEYILWKGKPERGFLVDDMIPVMTVSGGCCIALGLLLCAYVFSRSQMDADTALFCCFFCLFGLIFMIAQPLGKSSERKKMCYVITNKRILLKDGKKVFSFSGENLPPMKLYSHKNGNSTLSFGRVLYDRDDGKAVTGFCRLENLSDAERAKEALRALRQETDKKTKQYHALNVESEEIKETEENHTISGQRFEQVTYDPTGHIPDAVILQTYMNFPFSFNMINGSNDIHAVYRNLRIEMSDVQLEKYISDAYGSSDSYCDFKGQWFICHFDRKFPADLYVSVRRKDKRKKTAVSELEEVLSGEPAFDAHFRVLTGDSQSAGHMLNPDVARHILRLEELGCGDIYMNVSRMGIVHLAVESERFFFELNDRKTGREDFHRKYAAELDEIALLLDEILLMEQAMGNKKW